MLPPLLKGVLIMRPAQAITHTPTRIRPLNGVPSQNIDFSFLFSGASSCQYSVSYIANQTTLYSSASTPRNSTSLQGPFTDINNGSASRINVVTNDDDQADTLEMKVRKSGLSGEEWQVESI
ncbi:hypothetical protein V8E53_014250 [Lactarius tabidus]